ncbi:MAG: hypoxanthine phosphoribosyltransferase [Epulopiscium sp.]|nr:hypoxanthine phosphoribosyltransferase [Candidatus Epulonipiscium sp.]
MEHLDILISEEEIKKRVKELAKEITKNYKGKDLCLICVLKGAIMFMVDLAKEIDLLLEMDFMAVSSYGNEKTSSGVVKIIKDLDEPIEGKHVLIVEDIIDSGRTLSYLVKILKDRKPASIRICTLLDKPEKRLTDVKVDYVGFTIEDKFVLGYGLDYMQKYRNIPYIAVMKDEDN